MKSLSLVCLLVILFAASAIADSCAKFPEALKLASQLRGLAQINEVLCVQLKRSDFDRQASNTRLDRRVLHFEGIAFKSLGLIPDSFDYEGCAEIISQADALASYQPDIKSITVPSEQDSSMALLAHEAVHALQDQHFDLVKLKQRAGGTTDSALALDALIEGDAVRIEKLINGSGATDDIPKPLQKNLNQFDSRCNLPEIFLAQADLSYFFGPLFVETVQSEFNIDQLFQHPPTTTAEIMHPRDYVNKRKMAARPLELASADVVLRDRLGEFMIRSLLKLWVSPSIAITAASGWVDDDLSLRREGTQQLLLSWQTTWQSAKDSSEFWDAILQVFEKRSQTKLNHAANQLIVEAPHFPAFNLRHTPNSVWLIIKIAPDP